MRAAYVAGRAHSSGLSSARLAFDLLFVVVLACAASATLMNDNSGRLQWFDPPESHEMMHCGKVRHLEQFVRFCSRVPLLTVCLCVFSTSRLRLAVIQSSRTFARGTLKDVALIAPTNAPTSSLACASRFCSHLFSLIPHVFCVHSHRCIFTHAATNTHCILTLLLHTRSACEHADTRADFS